MPKAKLEINQSLIAKEHQGAWNEVFVPMMNKTLLTSTAYVKNR
jgi:recombinational DNA repair protein RecT